MNKELFDFYRGVGPGPQNLTLNEILLTTHGQFEASHTWIQWLFPLPEPSKHNPNAPLLDDETIEAMKSSKECQENLEKAVVYFMTFLAKTLQTWITPRNHNYLRITRAIRCCMLLNQSYLARTIFATSLTLYLQQPDIIGEDTVKYWEQALTLQVPGQ